MSIRVEYLGTYPIDSICKEHGSSVFILVENDSGKRICHQDEKGNLCETGIAIDSQNANQARQLLRQWADNH